jgi:hypothetical protein
MKSLTDVVSGAGLSVYAEIALVIFLVAFLGVVISLFLPGRQRTYEHLRHLPIEPTDVPDRDSSRSALYASAGNDNHA